MAFDPSHFPAVAFWAPSLLTVGFGVASFKLWKKGRQDSVELKDFRKAYNSLSTLAADNQKAQALKKALALELSHLKATVATYGQQAELVRVGLYHAQYTLPDTAAYKAAILEVREKQKESLKTFTALTLFPGADTSRKSMDLGRLALRTFNLECDSRIGRVSSTNMGDCQRHITRSFELVNKYLENADMAISLEYLQLKNNELQLAFEYACLRADEVDAARAERERVRAEQAEQEARDELAAAEQEIAQSTAKLRAAERKAAAPSPEQDLVMQEVRKLQALVQSGTERKERAQSMAQKTKAGYVYIISNIGSFGENMFKVGMTRRLNPMDRVIELGDAAVPFTFDVHAFIFSEDAPGLESSLHNELRAFAVNKVNSKKEFFYVDLQTIINAVNKYHGPFRINPGSTALEYRKSLALAHPGEYPMPNEEPPEIEFIEFRTA